MPLMNLDIEKTIYNISSLSKRIQDRFPESSLLKVSYRLREIAEESKRNVFLINKPFYFFRILFIVIFAALIILAGMWIASLEFKQTFHSLNDLLQSGEAAISAIALIGAAFFFVYKLEDYFKSRIILRVFHDLRVIAHVIDMHQLTKDPDVITAAPTAHSPARTLTTDELYRYLDYCCELLSLTSKVAVFYANDNRDQLIVSSIHEIEILTTTLSRKIWQKISLLKKN